MDAIWAESIAWSCAVEQTEPFAEWELELLRGGNDFLFIPLSQTPIFSSIVISGDLFRRMNGVAF